MNKQGDWPASANAGAGAAAKFIVHKYIPEKIMQPICRVQ